MLHGMWVLPRPGLEPVSPAPAGRFLTTAPPRKSPVFSFKLLLIFSWVFVPFDLICSPIQILLFVVFPNSRSSLSTAGLRGTLELWESREAWAAIPDTNEADLWLLWASVSFLAPQGAQGSPSICSVFGMWHGKSAPGFKSWLWPHLRTL